MPEGLRGLATGEDCMEALDVRVLRSVPTPVADGLLARGCRTAGEVLARPEKLQDALRQLNVRDAEERAAALLAGCRQEVLGDRPAALVASRGPRPDPWGGDSALQLLQQAQASQPVRLPCQGLNQLLGGALRPGGAILELCGLPGSGKTQFCLQLCAAAQIPDLARPGPMADSFEEAIFVDTEGSFVPTRYMQICRGLLAERRPGAGPAELEAVMRRLHVCRPFDATELYASLKQLGAFLQSRPRVRALVVDSVAFCFRSELLENAPQRARVLTDIAATLRGYGARNGLLVAVTNHMTARFDKNAGDNGAGWLAPALGETWAHQPSTQVRFEKAPRADLPSRAILTKSMEQAVGRSCPYHVCEAGLRDAPQARAEPALLRDAAHLGPAPLAY